MTQHVRVREGGDTDQMREGRGGEGKWHVMMRIRGWEGDGQPIRVQEERRGRGRGGRAYRDAEFSFERDSVWVPLMLFDASSHGVIFHITSVEALAGWGEGGASGGSWVVEGWV